MVKRKLLNHIVKLKKVKFFFKILFNTSLFKSIDHQQINLKNTTPSIRILHSFMSFCKREQTKNKMSFLSFFKYVLFIYNFLVMVSNCPPLQLDLSTL